MSKITSTSLPQRNQTVDICRIIIAFGVVTLHVQSSTPSAGKFSSIFWPLCVPFFFLASLAYFTKSLKKESDVKEVLSKIFKRLIVPFLCWSFIYFSLQLGKSLFLHQHKTFSYWRIFIYGGGAVHLYFQSSLICFQLLAFSAYLFIKKGFQISSLLLFVIGAGYFIVGGIYDCFGVSSSGQYFGIALFILLGFISANLLNKTGHQLFLLLIGIFLLSIIYAVYFGNIFFITISGYWIFFPLGGFGLLLICLGYPIRKTPSFFSQLSINTYGIYLCHILFLEGFELVTEKILKQPINYNIPTKVLVVAGIFLAANLLTIILRRIKLTRILLLGESK